MLWFKHMTDARHDPFVWDLRREFGALGYLVYFGTLEIYADSFRPSPGWVLNISIEYLKHELGIYHLSKLTKILDFIRSWPDVDRRSKTEDSPEIVERYGKDRALSSEYLSSIPPKWVAHLSSDRVSIWVPNFAKIMDDYSKKKARQMGAMSGQCPENVPLNQKGREEIKNPGSDAATIFRDLVRDCEALDGIAGQNGRRFRGADFVGSCIRKNYHPGAIRDGTAALLKKGDGAVDPWGYGLGVIKSREQFYKNHPIDRQLIQTTFWGFFDGQR